MAMTQMEGKAIYDFYLQVYIQNEGENTGKTKKTEKNI